MISKGVRLQNFLPLNKDDFYRYNGSLTTPGCDEIVIWTIFKQQLEVSQDQINVLRQVTYKQSDDIDLDMDLSNNYRPAQNLNGRRVLDVRKIVYQAKIEPSVAIAGWGSVYQESNRAETVYTDMKVLHLLIVLEIVSILLHFKCHFLT